MINQRIKRSFYLLLLTRWIGARFAYQAAVLCPFGRAPLCIGWTNRSVEKGTSGRRRIFLLVVFDV